jgi:protein O-GlcNAc transferase
MAEFQLLLACARVVTTQEGEASIRQMLEQGIDWTLFARRAIDHNLASLAGHTLARVAPDLVPDDILDALRMNIEQTRKKNQALFEELCRVLEALAKGGIEAIPFKGPVLAMQAYGDLGLRVFADLDFLVHDSDMVSTMAALLGLGYERTEALSEAQIAMIQRLQGQDFVYRKAIGIGVEPHTRLTPIKMALDIDYAALWRRAQRTNLHGRTVLTLAPEDDLLILAIHGGKELWWNIKWACDIAAFIASHPKLDWMAIVERARAQGCLRMVLLATLLACKYFNTVVPDSIVAAQRADHIIEPMVERIVAHWNDDEPMGSPSNKALSMARLRLHDGVVRRARYVARTLLLPGRHHVAAMPLPKGLHFAYGPIKIAHDIVALPLWRGYRKVAAQAGRFGKALMNSDLVLAIKPASRETRLIIKRHQKARADAKRVLAANPNHLGAWWHLADAMSGLKRYNEAIACYDRVLAFMPDHRILWRNRVAALKASGKKEGLPVLSINLQDSQAWTFRAGAFWSANRFAEVVEASDRALAINPENTAVTRISIHSRLHSCDWRRREDDKRQITAGLKRGKFVVRSMDHRGLCDDEEELRLSARFVSRDFRSPAAPLWQGERYHHDKIRIAYMSTDLQDHVVGLLIVGCFECHDKARFETTAISLSPGDGSDIRKRIETAFDRFIDVGTMDDAQIAGMLRALEIDIVIDLNGYSGEIRSSILAHRPAPVQVSYLGFAGTMDVPFIDYIIADHLVIPCQNQIHYSEKVVYLPHSYMPNDRKRPIAERTPDRSEVGLPETGFVFACLNHTYKISPEMFDVWMRLLTAIEGSVLWLRSISAAAVNNLRREAQARGVAPGRLLFVPWAPRAEDHLARLRLADLFLDTLPYNAHGTACDALWAGLPVLTCIGNAFPGRVGASLLQAVGLPELVTSTLAEYEELALTLARNPERLAAIKEKLMRNRDTEPLFDTARFTRDLESAYIAMWERQEAGLAPTSFAFPG